MVERRNRQGRRCRCRVEHAGLKNAPWLRAEGGGLINSNCVCNFIHNNQLLYYYLSDKYAVYCTKRNR